ncbi:hypothetical protein AB0I68_22455 [Streptomyces sp. NPDC050448]|uniref:hypothetical protein n=1 Tax=Streptomyces sp. NPDC050448 TaxID=3155404 RepID=UPI0034198B9C
MTPLFGIRSDSIACADPEDEDQDHRRTPREALTSVVIAAGLLVTGGLFFLVMLTLGREALETEPGDASAFGH